MHQHQWNTVPANDVSDRFIEAQTAHVIYKARACVNGCLCNNSLGCIDRDCHVREPFPNTTYHGQNTAQFFLSRNGAGARPGRFPAHVNPIRPGSSHRGSVFNGCTSVNKAAAVGKRIRGHIEHTRNYGPHSQTNKPPVNPNFERAAWQALCPNDTPFCIKLLELGLHLIHYTCDG